MKNRRFSSPFISFYEIVIIPTSGSFPSLWITTIHSTFPCSLILLLYLPDCYSPLVLPVVSHFPSSTVSTHDTVFQLKFYQCWRPLWMSCKDTDTHPHIAIEKRLSLCAWACVTTRTQWRGVTCACTNAYIVLKKMDCKFKYRHKRVNKTNHTTTSCLLCHVQHLYILLAALNWSFRQLSTDPINCLQTYSYAGTAIPCSFRVPSYNTCSESSSAWGVPMWSCLHPERTLV